MLYNRRYFLFLFLQIKFTCYIERILFWEYFSWNEDLKKSNKKQKKNVYKVYRQLDHDFHVSSIENECISIKNTFMVRSILKGRFFLFFVLSVSSCEVIKLFTCLFALFVTLRWSLCIKKVKSFFPSLSACTHFIKAFINKEQESYDGKQ